MTHKADEPSETGRSPCGALRRRRGVLIGTVVALLGALAVVLVRNAWICDDAYITLRTVDNFVARLRAHIGDDAERPRHLETVRGVGYRFNP